MSLPPIRVLFRFRDLVQPTIPRHKEILRESNMVWWGWWKRPTEDARSEIWDFLDLELKKNGKVRIGLFDSGMDDTKSTIIAAWIDSIRKPKADDQLILDPVKLKASEQSLVPRYYRTSPFSRAWMRIVDFEEAEVPFFNEYSFEEAPPHLKYSKSVAKQLSKKVILSPRELREMDSTLWRVRPRQPEDSTAEFLTGKTQIQDALSDSPIRTTGSTILHITDPHFAKGANRDIHTWRLESENDNRDSLAVAIGRAMAGTRVAAIVVTGDLTFIGDESEFDEARTALIALQGSLGIGPEQTVVVPGNHDIQWSVPAGSTYSSNTQVTVQPGEATRNYRKFYRALLGHEANDRLTIARRFVLANGILLDVCGVNSSTLATGKNFLTGMGKIDNGSLEEAAKRLGWHNGSSLSMRLIALHHHLLPAADMEDPAEFQTGLGMAIDATSIQRSSARYGVHLALHGHKHRAFIWRSECYELPDEAYDNWSSGALALLGGGSAGAKMEGEQKNFFNAITFYPDKIVVELYRSKHNGEFRVVGTWEVQLHLQDGRIVCGAWKKIMGRK